MKHIRPDSLGPDPFEIIEGFKQLPHYRCDHCYERKPDTDDRYIFDRDTGFHEWKMLCRKCWEVEKAR